MPDTATVTIAAGRPVLTLINVYDVDPARQEELVTLLTETTDSVMRHLPGFLSVSIHRSLDGTRVANYAQWASTEAFERMLRHPEAQARVRALAGVATRVSPVVYQVSAVHTS